MYAICDKCRHIFKIKKRKRIYRECQNCRSTGIEYITNIEAQRMLEKGKSTIPTKSIEKKMIKKKGIYIDPQIRKDFIKFNRAEHSIKANKDWIASRYGIKRDKAERIAKSFVVY
jgi:hypothetical protein